jgi:multidrug efflux system membrane fusion protein
VVFTLPEEDLGKIAAAMAAGEVAVAAVGRDGGDELDRGKIAVLDNQIDQATGTLRIKATFPNLKNRLWPGAYVSARVLLQTRRNTLTIPAAALQRGPSGPFAYVVKEDSTIEMRPLKVANDNGSLIMVDGGLAEGERVTVNNEYRMQPGVHVRVVATP